jgi:hypothetical protein
MLPPPVDAAGERPQTTGSGTRPDIVNADVDVAEFSDTTLDILREVAGVWDSESLPDALRRLLARNSSRAELVVLKKELIDLRNAKLLATFDERAAAHATIVIPWGALHMPGIEAGLRERGYRIESRRTRPVVRFRRIVDWLVAQRSA